MAHDLMMDADDWDQAHAGDRCFIVLPMTVTVRIGDYLELQRVEFEIDEPGARFEPRPLKTPNGQVAFLLVKVTCVCPPGSYGLDHEHQLVGFRRLGFV